MGLIWDLDWVGFLRCVVVLCLGEPVADEIS